MRACRKTVLTLAVLVAWSCGAEPAWFATAAAHDRPLPGLADADAEAIGGRHRFEFEMGYWDSGGRAVVSGDGGELDEVDVENLVGAFTYSRWLSRDLATLVALRGLLAEAGSSEGPDGRSERSVVISSALFGIRYYPLSLPGDALRVYASAGVGPYLGVEAEQHGSGTEATRSTTTQISFGGHLGLGLDIRFGRHLMAGVGLGYHLTADFDEPIGGRRNYDGPELRIGLSLLLG